MMSTNPMEPVYCPHCPHKMHVGKCPSCKCKGESSFWRSFWDSLGNAIGTAKFGGH